MSTPGLTSPLKSVFPTGTILGNKYVNNPQYPNKPDITLSKPPVPNLILDSLKVINSKDRELYYNQQFPAKYFGPVNDISNWSNRLLASKINDLFNISTQSLTYRTSLSYNFFEIIAEQTRDNKILLCFDKTWPLLWLKEYIEKDGALSIYNDEIIKEADLAWISGHREISKFKPSNLKLSELSIFQVYWGGSKQLLIFAPVTLDEANTISIYLYLNGFIRAYSSVYCVKNYPFVKTFEYLFPISVTEINGFDVFHTKNEEGNFIIPRDDLEHLVDFGEVIFHLPELDELVGCYATYILAEDSYYEYKLKWSQNKLYIGQCGYVEAKVIYKHFTEIVTEIVKKKITFTKTALDKIKGKGFWYYGYYTIEESGEKRRYPKIDIGLIEMLGPLEAITREDLFKEAKIYLEFLGYQVLPNPDSYLNNIRLYYTEEKVTRYMYDSYTTTHTIAWIYGNNDIEIHNILGELLHRGYFFNQTVKNITRHYPDFVPDYPPLQYDWPHEPSKLKDTLRQIYNSFFIHPSSR